MIRHLVVWPLLALLAFTEAAAVADALGGPPKPAQAIPAALQPSRADRLYEFARHVCLPNGTTAAGERCA
jgi:hypothetical protein